MQLPYSKNLYFAVLLSRSKDLLFDLEKFWRDDIPRNQLNGLTSDPLSRCIWRLGLYPDRVPVRTKLMSRVDRNDFINRNYYTLCPETFYLMTFDSHGTPVDYCKSATLLGLFALT